MLKIFRLFEIILDDKNITNDRTAAFASHHLRALMAMNTEGIYDTMIAALTLKLSAYYQINGTWEYDIVLKEAGTMLLDKAQKEILNSLVPAEAEIIKTFGNDKIVYHEFFPNGLSEFHKATRSDMGTILVRFLKACETHTTQLDPVFVAHWTTLRNNYREARLAQEQKMGLVKGDSATIEEKMDELKDQLHDDMHNLAIIFKRRPQMARVFFNQSLLFKRHKIIGGIETFEGEILAQDTVVITANFTPEEEFTVKNDGPVDLLLCFGDEEDTACVVGIVVAIGKTEIISAMKLNTPEAKNFKITNTDLEITGKYKITRPVKK